jgi:fatty acid desaturase
MKLSSFLKQLKRCKFDSQLRRVALAAAAAAAAVRGVVAGALGGGGGGGGGAGTAGPVVFVLVFVVVCVVTTLSGWSPSLSLPPLNGRLPLKP